MAWRADRRETLSQAQSQAARPSDEPEMIPITDVKRIREMMQRVKARVGVRKAAERAKAAAAAPPAEPAEPPPDN